MYKELRFTFLDVLELLSCRFTPQRTHGEVMTTCPICGNKRFAVNLDKQKGHCLTASCGSGGRGFNAKQFYAVSCNISTDEAYHTIMQSLGYETKADGTRAAKKERTVYSLPEEAERADIATRDKAYSRFLEELTLEDEDRENLKARGFTDEAIESLGYKTFPAYEKGNYFEICRRMQADGISLKGIPGFYMSKKGDWTFAQLTKGVIMPCRDAANRIQALQIRKRDSLRRVIEGDLEAKCGWFSSKGRKNGCGSGAPVHFACDWVWKGKNFTPYFDQKKEGAKKGFALTEGIMKADLCHMFKPDIPLIAVPGVDAVKDLEPILQWLHKKGVEVILHAYDMDYKTNPNVKVAMEKTEKLIKNCGLAYKAANWNTTAVIDGKKYDVLKGMDDYFAYIYAGIVPKIKKLEEAG